MFGFIKRKLNLNLFNAEAGWIYAPLSGTVIPLKEVSDAVFSQGVMGDGVGIEPENDILYSPINGRIFMIFPTKHALGIEDDNGAKILIHVGIDTVELHGKYFDMLVKNGDRVRVGDAILKADFKAIREQYAATTMITVENSAEFHMQISEKRKISAGDKLIKLVRREEK